MCHCVLIHTILTSFICSKLDNSKLGPTQQWMTLTCSQDHILTENIWFVWSETSYSGDKMRCYNAGRTNERTTEDRATQPMEAGGWVSQFQRQHVRNTPLVSLEKYMWPNLRNTGFGVVGGGREFAMGGGRLSSGPRGTKGERSAVPPLSTSHPRKWNLPPNTQDTQDIQDTSCYRPLTVNRDKYTIPNTKYTIINRKCGMRMYVPHLTDFTSTKWDWCNAYKQQLRLDRSHSQAGSTSWERVSEGRQISFHIF